MSQHAKRKRQYLRFTVAQRIEHWVMTTSFVILAVTGLPQKFVGSPWAENMIAAMGGIEQVRIFHRYAAIVLMLSAIYHGAVVTYKVMVQRVELSMMPGWQDVKDLLGALANNLGLSPTRPKLPRYNFEEKIEYWALVWGTVIMIITGFMLWNPIASAKFLPGSFIPAAKAAHGGEALLAVAAIIIWHMYHVHIRRLNKSMFTGKLSAKEMAHDHALELEQIAQGGALRLPVPPEEEIKRARIFWPVAALISIILLFSLYLFVTFEETAIPVALAEETTESAFQPITLSSGNGGSLHATIQAYTGSESCAASGCHTARPLETAATSPHSQRIAAAGPNPWLAKLVDSSASAGDPTPDCLICHAQVYQPDDPVASAQTVRAAGGETCLRCHSEHPLSSVHTEVGLACVSCHTSIHHQIQTRVACQACHAEMPHADPLLNTKHTRLDCRTCHIRNDKQLVVDASQSKQNPVTSYFDPTVETTTGSPIYAWQTDDGAPASADTEGAVIVPVMPVTAKVAPDGFDPVDFAHTGNVNGATQETTFDVPAGHGVTREDVRTCDTCHGPNGDFDFAGLYDEEQAGNLSAKPTETE